MQGMVRMLYALHGVDTDLRLICLQEEAAASWPPTETPATAAEGKQHEDLQRAGVIQAFLEGTSSQLTEHGLISLHQVKGFHAWPLHSVRGEDSRLQQSCLR